MKKKAFALILCAAMCLGALAGCGRQKAAEQTETTENETKQEESAATQEKETETAEKPETNTSEAEPAEPITPTNEEMEMMEKIGAAYINDRLDWYWQQTDAYLVTDGKIPADALLSEMYGIVWGGLVTYDPSTNQPTTKIVGITFGQQSEYGYTVTVAGDTLNAIADMLYAKNEKYEGATYDLAEAYKTGYKDGENNQGFSYNEADNTFFLGADGDPGEGYPMKKNETINDDGTITFNYVAEDPATYDEYDCGYVTFAPLNDGNQLFRYGISHPEYIVND